MTQVPRHCLFPRRDRPALPDEAGGVLHERRGRTISRSNETIRTMPFNQELAAGTLSTERFTQSTSCRMRIT